MVQNFNLFNLFTWAPRLLSYFFPLSTELVFIKLLEMIQPEIVCDIGSRNGSESLKFKNAIPLVESHAFEANPYLVEQMRFSKNLANANINIHGYALADCAGEAVFSIADLEQGNGSIREWENFPTLLQLKIQKRRLDSFFEANSKRYALWLDVEGCAYEVLCGATSILSNVALIHVEVETSSVWRGQKTMGEIKNLLLERGFYIANAAYEPEISQGDLVFVAKKFSPNPLRLSLEIIKLSFFETMGIWLYKAGIPKKIPRIYNAVRAASRLVLRK